MEQHQEEKRRKVRKQSFVTDMLKVVLLNDDVTTFDFVVRLLVEVFYFNDEDAWNLAKTVDKEGRGEVGVYPADIARSKVEVATQMARSNNFPLRIITENA